MLCVDGLFRGEKCSSDFFFPVLCVCVSMRVLSVASMCLCCLFEHIAYSSMVLFSSCPVDFFFSFYDRWTFRDTGDMKGEGREERFRGVEERKQDKTPLSLFVSPYVCLSVCLSVCCCVCWGEDWRGGGEREGKEIGHVVLFFSLHRGVPSLLTRNMRLFAGLCWSTHPTERARQGKAKMRIEANRKKERDQSKA